MQREVAITGVGMISPLGATADACAHAWRMGHCAQRRPHPGLAGTPLEDIGVATPPEVDVAKRLGGRKMVKYMSDAALLGCIAAHEALEDAAVSKRFAPERMGLYAGVGLAAANPDEIMDMVDKSVDANGELSCGLLGERGFAATNPLLSFKILPNMPPCLISIVEGIKGPNLIFTPWEGQTGAAIQEGWLAVASGAVDCALVGAADTPAHPSTFVYLRQSRNIGEEDDPANGAAYLVLETRQSARRDGKTVYATLENVAIASCEGGVEDPLSERMGRSFAAAPAILLALTALTGGRAAAICGADRRKLEFALGGDA